MNHGWLKYLPKFLYDYLDGRHVFQKAIGNTGWLMADRVLRMIIGLVVIVWVARYLGPENFGLLNYSIAFASLFLAFATLGLDNIVIREIVNNPESTEEIIGSAFFLKLVGGLFAFLLASTAVFFMKPSDDITAVMVFIIALGMVFQSFDIIDFWFQSRVEAKYTVAAKSTAFFLSNVAKVSLVMLGASVVAFAWVTLAEVIIGAAGLVTVYIISGQSMFSWRVRFSCIKTLLSSSWPLMLSAMAVVIYMKIDQVMIGEMLGVEAVGIYSVAVQLSEVWYFIPVAICSSIFPSIIEARNVNEKLYFKHLQNLYTLMIWLAICISLPLAFFASDIVSILYGSQYSGAAVVLSIHIWASIFVFLGVAAVRYLMIEDLTKISFLITIIGAIVNVVLNLILIPIYGIQGAAVATLVSYFSTIFVLVFTKQTNYQTLMMLKSFLLIPFLKGKYYL